ncbi:MAG: PQQ-binding-like beta-propeller repeat protein [Gemmataceae bacterium]|nr:PQQ-binding-like beta-propeller repeat protein [Gemmataceae bacterium]
MRFHWILASLLVGTTIGGLNWPLRASDWLHWRGPFQNGVALDTGLPDKFSLDPSKPGSNLIWVKHGYGCRSTPIVMNGRLYFLGSVGSGLEEGERLVCMDANTGEVIWEDFMNVFHSDIVSNRVGWTSPVGDAETGYVYIHGTQGFFRCYDKDGKIVWQHNLSEEYGRVTGYGGRVVGPTVDGNVVVVGLISSSWGDFARGANRFVAFDKRNGNVVWWSTVPGVMGGTYYSNPVVATINGQRLLITGGSDGALHAFQLNTGKLVWSYPFGKNMINSSPAVAGNFVVCSHGEENLDTTEQGRIICVDASQVENGHPKLVWEFVGQKFGYASPLIHDNVVYAATDSARLYKFDLKTGKILGKPHVYGRLGRGSPVWADGKIYIFNVNGEMSILKPTEKGFEELHVQKFRLRQGTGFVETDGTPAVANGRVYFGTLESMYCIGTGKGQAGPPILAEPIVRSEKPPAQVALYPADVVLKPGQSVELELRAFDEDGWPVETLPAGKFQITLPPVQPGGRQPPALVGNLEPSQGRVKLTVSPTVPAQQGYVDFIAAENMVARCRVRVAPQLPYEQNFDKVPIGGTPGGWINTMGKFDVVKKGDEIVLRKLAVNPLPPVARANAFIGTPDWTDYTIQVDVCAQEVRGGLPDAFGVLNCRYHLLLDGKADPDLNNQRRLRLTTWEALPRIDKSVPFHWQPEVWYTMKLRVEMEGKVALIRGKVWERGKPEPSEWNIEFRDPSPNREGAPALYAFATNILDNAPGSEVYFDNLVIRPNKSQDR